MIIYIPKISLEYWDEAIPIKIGQEHTKIVDTRKFEYESVEGQSYAQIVEESEEVIIQIFQIKDNQLLSTLKVPKLNIDKYTKEIEFSSEYLIYIRNQNYEKVYVYFHNFKLNKGINLHFEKCHVQKWFFLQDQFYIQLSSGYAIRLELYRIDNNLNVNLIAERDTSFYDCVKQVVLLQPIFFIMERKMNQLSFLSNSLKSVKMVIFKDDAKFDIFAKRVEFIIIKDMFLIDQDNHQQTLLSQNRNGKLIRKIYFSKSPPSNFQLKILKHYVIASLNSNELKVYDLMKGCMKTITLYLEQNQCILDGLSRKLSEYYQKICMIINCNYVLKNIYEVFCCQFSVSDLFLEYVRHFNLFYYFYLLYNNKYFHITYQMKCGRQTDISIMLKDDLISSLQKVDNIPIDLSGKCLYNTKFQQFYHLSMDCKQYAKLIKQKGSVSIEIYQIKQNELVYQIEFPLFCSIKDEEIIKFSSEYLVYVKNMLDSQTLDLYIHNFKLNKGKFISRDELCFETCYFQSDQFYLLLSNVQQISWELQKYRIDQDLEIHLEKVFNMGIIDWIYYPKSECRFNFIMCRFHQFCFLSNQFKPINNIIFEDLFYIDFDSQLILQKNIFIINYKNTQLICQNRNGKRIRRLKLYDGKNQLLKILLIKHHLFAHFSFLELKVYDLVKGYTVSDVFVRNQISRVEIIDNYIFFGNNQHNIGFPLCKTN